MLTSLSLERFKSWKQIKDMRLAPITGLFGSNSSGKTSILQLLLMLKQTVESPDRAQVLNLGGDERSLAALGTFREVVHKHETPSLLQWGLSWTLPQELVVADPEQEDATLFSGRDMEFHAEVAENGAGRMVVKKLQYGFADHDFAMTRKSEAEEKYILSAGPSDFRFKRRKPGRAWDLPPPVKCYGFPDQVRTYHQNAEFLADFELAFEELFSHIHYLGPLREYPKREYLWAGAQPTDMGRRGEKAIDAMLASREREKISRGKGHKKLTVEEYVAWWLQELGLIHSFSVRPITKGSNLYQVWVRKTADAPEVLITDVGFGVSQILPVLVLCYYVPEGSILILEQPEIHLHPSVQTGLADVFIDAIETRKVQIILESHSEYLLRRLQRRIAEEKLSKNDAALYFCDIVDGISRLTPLELDIFGNIENWPKDFFGDEFGEMAAMTQAVIDRKKRQ